VLVDAGNGLINDTDLNITWTKDANLFSTLADAYQGGGHQAEFVSAIINAAGGVVHDTPNVQDNAGPGSYNLSSFDFDITHGVTTWWGAQAWVSYLNSISYGGQTDWRLPAVSPVNDSGFSYNLSFDGTTDVGYNTTAINAKASELAHLFYYELGNLGAYDTARQPQGGYGFINSGPFQNLQSVYWSGTEFAPYPAMAFAFQGHGSQDINGKSLPGYVWAVRPGQVEVVPIPASIWLFVSALTGVGLFRARLDAQCL
jgi:hypothetical protein